MIYLMSDIQEFYGVEGAFGTFPKGRFRVTVDCYKEQVYYKWKKRKEALLWTKAGGESLHTIIVGDGAYNEDRNGKRIVDDFVTGRCRKCSFFPILCI